MGLEEAKAFVDGWVQREGAGRDRLLPLLHAVQDEIGYIDDALVPAIAAALSKSIVLGRAKVTMLSNVEKPRSFGESSPTRIRMREARVSPK